MGYGIAGVSIMYKRVEMVVGSCELVEMIVMHRKCILGVINNCI